MSDKGPFVNRHQPLREIEDVLTLALEYGEGRLVLVEGAIEVGKTALLGELRRKCDDAPQLMGELVLCLF